MTEQQWEIMLKFLNQFENHLQSIEDSLKVLKGNR